MFASKSSTNKPENSFQATLNCHNVHEKSYEELLAVSNDVSVHEKHFCISVYKSLMKTNSDFMWYFYAINLFLMNYVLVRNSICPLLTQHKTL